jgi:hypothetical protein
MEGIAGIKNYYLQYYPDYIADNQALIEQAITALQEAYRDSVFPEQKADWTSHPNNIGHKDTPGCFRCHDGAHLNAAEEAIRLECNLCHSIPVVAGPSDFVTEIEISRGPEPQSHLNPNWITLHRDVFDASCSNCHTTDNPGGVDNSSFCSNSACHGSAWEFAGFDAPSLREVLEDQLAEIVPDTEMEPSLPAPGALTYGDTISSLLSERCGACHGDGALGGLTLTTYEALLAGGQSGAVLIPGDPEGSLLIQVQSSDTPHFAHLASQELMLVSQWIAEGAIE